MIETYTEQLDDLGNVVGYLKGSYGRLISINPADPEYQAFQKWKSDGNVALNDPNQTIAKKRARLLKQLKSDVSAYLYSRYSQGTQTTLLGLNSKWSGVLINPASTTAQKATAAARLATLLTVANWMSTVWNEYYTKRDAFNADPTLTTIAYDFTQFDVTDPQVSAESVRV